MSRFSRTPPQPEMMTMAVRMMLTREVSRAQLARDFGIGMPTLSRWIRDTFDQAPFGDVLETLHDEVGALRKENAALKKLVSGRIGRGGATAAGRAKPE